MRILLSGSIIALGLSLVSCSGDDGKDGAVGPAGAQGEQGDAGPPGPTGKTGPQGDQGDTGKTGAQGEQGPQGEQGDPGTVPDGTLNVSCLKPCHTFSGIVEQWKTSRHYATYIANLGGEEVDTWTGAKACGNCHAIDGLEQRVAGNVTFSGTTGPVALANGQLNYKDSGSSQIKEIVYAGQATVAVVGCDTCHDTSAQNDPHVTGATEYKAGSFPLRAPTGEDDFAIVEASSAVGTSDGTMVNYGKGNACVWCHKSRKDVTNYVLADNNNISSTTWGPHEGPQSDIYTGTGGYQYANKSYANSSHSNFKNGCVDCHMPAVNDNMGIGDHSFYPQLTVCGNCHNNPPNFDVLGGQSKTTAWLQNLRVALNGLELLTRDGTNPLDDDALADEDFASDEALPQSGVTGDVAGALYNYFLVARGSGLGVHNPSYTYQLLYDSVAAVHGTQGGTRP